MISSCSPSAGAMLQPDRALLRRWLLPFLFFVAACFLFTRDNGFPYLYHTDEPGKVAQIANGQWNLRHPPLLLLVTKAAVRVFGPATSPQEIAVLGRDVSAVFAAGAVAGLVLLAQGSFGWPTGALAGVLALSSPQLFELAHYFKEDTALAFGVVLLWLAMTRAARQSGWSAAVALGAAAAIAVSSKYLGILALVFAIASEALSRLASQPRRLWQGQVVLFGTFVIVVAALNVPLLFDASRFANSLQVEMSAVVRGEGGIAQTSPITTYLKSLWIILGWPVLTAGVLGLMLHGALPKKFDPLPKLLPLFPLVYLAVIACSPKTSSRYLLPVTLSLTFFAAVLPATLAPFVERYFARWLAPAKFAVPALLGLGLAVSQVMNFLPTMQGFHRDARSELVTFLNTHLAPDAQLVAERHIGLDLSIDGKEKLRPFGLQQKECAADLGTVAELRQQGVGYVITHGPTRHMFTSATHLPQAEARADYERRRSFYEQLDRECRQIWRTRKSKVVYLSPDLRVYDLAHPPAGDAAGKAPKP
jgi:hypothetical protein